MHTATARQHLTSTLILGLAALSAGAGCGLERTSSEPPSWEEFRTAATRHVDGREIYVVEWDLARTLEELRAYYDRNVAGRGLGVSEQAVIVRQVGGADDVWTNGQQLNLTYCVSNEFGILKARAVAEMAAAARAWEDVVNVDFRYVPAQDGACNNTNPNVVFSVRPWTNPGACAFFPSGGGCVPRTVVINYPDLDNNYETIAPNVDTVGVFRHELGHVLGLRHEHTRPEAGGVCYEDDSWRALTPYVRASVMHYPWCGGFTESDLRITASDATGIRQLYGGAACGGRTMPGATNWQQYGTQGLFVDVNTSACEFSPVPRVPRYFTSLGGDGNHWATAGAQAIYAPTTTGFRVYVLRHHGAITPAEANAWRWHINWHGLPVEQRRTEICTGGTAAGSTAWQAYGTQAVFVDVNTSACGYTAVPRYFTSLGGVSNHWATTGATSIYSPTATGFRVYVFRHHGPVSPAEANAWRWHLNWQAVPNNQRPPDVCTGGTTAGATAWQPYDPQTVFLDVNTSACGYTIAPRYTTSLGGDSNHWKTAGATSLYSPTATGFRVYVHRHDGPITPAEANAWRWHLNWRAQR